MATVLLLIIYAVFIGLGIPDSSFGPAWPAIFPDFNVPVSFANFVEMTVSLATVTASFFSAKVINKFGTGLVVAFSTFLSCFAILGLALAPSFWFMILLAIPLGLGAGAIDAALNNYVATHYKPMHMSFLHCFYGVGVSLSPLLMSFALMDNNDWRLGFRIIFYIMLVILITAIIALPLWKKTAKADGEVKAEEKPVTLPIKKMVKSRAVRLSWLMFFSTCALEFTCGWWGSTFLVKSEGVTESLAARFITFYYLGMTAGRFVSGLISGKLDQRKIVTIGYSITGVAIAILFLPIPPAFKGVALFLIGLGNGPTFPNMIYLTPIFFGKRVSGSIVGTQLACCNLGIMLMPPLFGLLAEVSATIFPYFLTACFILMVISTVLYVKKAKNTPPFEI
ncbi:MAG: MFS transporter [Clostridia bacterium]|nr:MFS transporter [Clostridia bacterium]